MEKILSLVKRIFVGYDRKKDQIGISIEFNGQKKTAAVATSDCQNDKTND